MIVSVGRRLACSPAACCHVTNAVRNLIADTSCSVAEVVATVNPAPARLLLLGGELDVTETLVGGEIAWSS